MHSYPDKVRGVLNEGGLFGERQGWHLPGFDTSDWTRRDLSEGLPGGRAGVGFFVTTFDLAFPKETDALVSFQFETENTQPYRALLFVNGWMFGKVLNAPPSKLLSCVTADGWYAARGEPWPTDQVSRTSRNLGLRGAKVSIFLSGLCVG